MKTNIFTLLLSLGLFLNLTSALISRPPKPSTDDFYKTPANMSEYKVGEIMKWRNTPTKVRSLVYPINIDGSWQFMVRSTNTQGDPIAIVGSILKPYNANPLKVLSYSFFEDSVSVDCAPSYSILFGAGMESLGNQFESIYMNAALTEGWFVVITDYEGPNAAFAASKLAGMATLDGIRAALHSGENTGIDAEAKVALWGYSGGTIPVSWAGVLQPTYAPELDDKLIGAAIGGWVTNITLVVEYIDGTLVSGLIGPGILGISSEYPDVKDKIFDLINPDKRDKVKTLYEKCFVDSMISFVRAKWFKGRSPIFTDGYKVLDKPEIQHMLNDNILAFDLTSPVPKVPFFVYYGEHDSIVPVDNSQRVYDSWCEKKIPSMELTVSRSSGHTTEFVEGGGAAFKWLMDRFEGKKPLEGCGKTVRLNNLLYPGAGQGFLVIVKTTIRGMLQQKLGPFSKILAKVFFKTLEDILDKIESHNPEKKE